MGADSVQNASSLYTLPPLPSGFHDIILTVFEEWSEWDSSLRIVGQLSYFACSF